MSTVSELMKLNRLTHDINGRKYECYRVTTGRIIEALGPGVLTIVDDIARFDQKYIDKATGKDNQVAMRKMLEVLMISPKLGDKDDDLRGIVTWQTMGDDGPRLYSLCMAATEEAARDFPESSEDQTE